MLDTLTSTNHTDFRQRYQHTFGWFNSGERKLLVYVESVSDKEVVFSDKQGTSYNVFRDSGLEFEFIPVDRGWFNTVNGPVYLTRVPARMWHRGICKSNTQIYRADPSGAFLVLPMGIKTLADIFENKVTVNESIKKHLEDGKTGVALSKHFAIAPNSSGNRLMFYDQRAGGVTVRNSRISVELSEKIVQQELSDLIRRNNFPMDLS